MTTNKRQLYRTAVKTLTLIGICILGYFLIRSIILPSTPKSTQQTPAVNVDLSSIPKGTIQVVQWNHKNIAVLHRPQEMQEILKKTNEHHAYFVFINSGGDINCPLTIEQKTKTMLKDICSGYLYDSYGKAIKQDARVQNLDIPPHHFVSNNKLIIGEN